MKAVMISIQPKWCELIVNGQKTIEVRKTRPNIKTPFKCYIYMTQGTYKDLGTYCDWIYENRMKVIGEFVCDRIYEIKNLGSSFMIGNDIALTNRIARESCLDYDDMIGYLGNKDGYAWHISGLKIYNKPKELGEFYAKCNIPESKCKLCDNCFDMEDYYGRHYAVKKLTRPPQSWCYVEEL